MAQLVDRRFVPGHGQARQVDIHAFAVLCVDQWVENSKEGTPEDLISTIEKNTKALLVALCDA